MKSLMFVIFSGSFLAGIGVGDFWMDGEFLKIICVFGFCFAVWGRVVFPRGLEGGRSDEAVRGDRVWPIALFGFLAGFLRIFVNGGEEVESFDIGIFEYMRGVFTGKVEELFLEPYAGLVSGILTGERGSISKDVLLVFNEVGLTHIMAVSGYNISIVICVVSGALGFLGRKWMVLCSVIFVVAFTAFVGAGSSVVRAAIMGIAGIVALNSGREYNVNVSLLFAAFIMCLLDPVILISDIGFQLSFLSTLGIVSLSDYFKKLLLRVPNFIGMRENLGVTLSAQVFVLPVILMIFGNLSVVSVLANILVLPLVPLIMLFGFLAVVGDLLCGFLGNILAFVTFVFIQIMMWIINFLASFPYANIEGISFPWILAVLWYVFLARRVGRGS